MSKNATDPEVLWGHDDDHTAALLAKHLASRPGVAVTALFEEEAVAQLWEGQPGVSIRVWEPTLVRDVLAAFPPQPVERLAAPPVVIGDSPIARRLVQEIAVGWGGVTEAVTIHCLGSDDTWAREAAGTAQHAEVTWLEVPLQVGAVIEAIEGLVAQWSPPKPDRGTRTGPTVYVAAMPEGRALAVARAVTAALPDARVVAVVSGDIAWPTPHDVAMFSTADARVRVAAQDDDSTMRLAQLLFEDVAWLGGPNAETTAPQAPLFTGIVHDSGGPASWEKQNEMTRAQFTRVADACPRVLAAGGVEADRCSTRLSEQVVFSPSELAAMAEEVLTLLGVSRKTGTWLTALELVARLPVLAARAGFVLRRMDSAPLLTPDLVELLAPQVHLAYEEASFTMGNASGSPLAVELWDGLTEFEKASNRAVIVGCAVAHAAEGLGWRRTTETGGVNLTNRLDRLGELEHRRWAIHERRHGRGNHIWAIPWDRLTPEMKSYDLLIMRAMPLILADAGLEVYEAGPAGPSAT